MYFDLIVIGGCASGLAAAINAKKLHPDYTVAVLEKLPRIGKKILVTGNGRCNLTNVNAVTHRYHNMAFAASALKKYNPDYVIEFFESQGLVTYADIEGRVYPKSNSATSVLDCLRFACDNYGIDVFCNTPVTSIFHSQKGFLINNKFKSKFIILSTGGKSSPVHGSDGSGYELAKSMGHNITDICPSLVPLKSDEAFLKSVKGTRISDVILSIKGIDEAISAGEIQFTESGVSGIAAMELSPYIKGSKNACLSVNLFNKEKSALSEMIRKIIESRADHPMDDLLSGIFPKAMGIAILKKSGIYSSQIKCSELTNQHIQSIVETILNFEINIVGVKGFNDSQVTRGGIDVSQINPKTMESKLIKGLYFAGEIIDVDGRCGGFNLQWAFASGFLAGELK